MAKINCLQSDYPTMINQTDFQDNSYAEHGKHKNTGKRDSFIISGLFFFFLNTKYGWSFSRVYM